MIRHTELGLTAFARMRKLKMLVDQGEIQLAGNDRLKIYGTFCCGSGKRLKAENRVFFQSEQQARVEGYRPCGHCQHEAYLQWKALS